jgi:hypothetical protein
VAEQAKAKRWWQRPATIVVAMVVWFPLGLILMWMYAPWRARWKWGWTAVFAAIVLLIGIAGAVGGGGTKRPAQAAISGGAPTQTVVTLARAPSSMPAPKETSTPKPSSTTEPSPTPRPTETPRPSPTPRPAATPSWRDGAPVTQDAVLAVLKDADTLPRSVDLGSPRQLGVDEPSGGIHIEYKTTSALNTTDYVTIGAQTAFSAMRALYANPSVQHVQVVLYTDFTDQLGNTTEDIATSATIEKATADQINWKGLSDLVLSDNKHLFCIADAYVLAPSIYGALQDTGCLTGPIRSLPG